VKRFVRRWITFAFVTKMTLTVEDVASGRRHHPGRKLWRLLAIVWEAEGWRPIRPETLAENYRNAMHDPRVQQAWADTCAASEEALAQGLAREEALVDAPGRPPITERDRHVQRWSQLLYPLRLDLWSPLPNLSGGLLQFELEVRAIAPPCRPLDDVSTALLRYELEALESRFLRAYAGSPKFRGKFHAAMRPEGLALALALERAVGAPLRERGYVDYRDTVDDRTPSFTLSWLKRNRRRIEAALREAEDPDTPQDPWFQCPITAYVTLHRETTTGT
jgi:hypothetical protein